MGRKSEKELPALAAQPRAFSSLLSLPSQAQSVIKAFRRQGIGDADVVNTARFFLSRLESLFASQKVFQIFRGRAEARLCDLFRSASAALHKSHRLASVRIKVVGADVLSDCRARAGKTLISRSNPSASGSCRALRACPLAIPEDFCHVLCTRHKSSSTAEVKIADGRFRVGDNLTVVPRQEGVLVDICMGM